MVTRKIRVPATLTLREGDPSTHWTGSWAGHRSARGALEMRIISDPYRQLNDVQAVANCDTVQATLLPDIYN